MDSGILLSLIGVLFIGIASTIQKFLAKKYENNLALVIQYVGVVLFAFLGLLIMSYIEGINMWPTITIQMVFMLLGIGIVGFIGILFLRKGFEKMNSGIVLVIANLSVFLMYFANLYLFDGGEKLPITQIILALIFFSIIAQFLVDKPVKLKKINIDKLNSSRIKSTKIRLNKAAIYPMITAICRSIFFVGNTYFIKNKILHPVQTQFFTEGTIAIIAILVFLWKFKAKFTSFKKIDLKDLKLFAIETLTLVTGSLLLYYAYLSTPANIVNVIRLFSIIITALLAWKFLKDKLNKRNMILMIMAFIILILFVFAENILNLF